MTSLAILAGAALLIVIGTTVFMGTLEAVRERLRHWTRLALPAAIVAAGAGLMLFAMVP